MSTRTQHRLESLDIEGQQQQQQQHQQLGMTDAIQSPKKNGTISIAELRTRFQKKDDADRSITSPKPPQLRPPLPVKPSTNAGGVSETQTADLIASKSVAASGVVEKQTEIIREMQQKFGVNSPALPNVPKKNHSSPSRSAKSLTTKPAQVAKSNGPNSDGAGHSSHKVQSSKSSTSTSLSPKNSRSQEVSPDLTTSVKSEVTTATTSSPAPKKTIRPNHSHLSSLISEIHQQQLQQQLQTKVSQQRQECSEPTPTPAPVLPRPPAVLPSIITSCTPPSLHRKTPSIDLGPPPPVPIAGKPSQITIAVPSPPTVTPVERRWRKKILPSLAELGPAPLKPPRPPNFRIASNSRVISAFVPESTPPLPQRNAIKNGVALPLPPRQTKPVPAPPLTIPSVEISQLSSVISGELKNIASSPIPEFTVEEELGDGIIEDFYDDTDGVHRTSSLISDAAQYSSGTSASQQDELYHDASIRSNEVDDFYEDISVGGESSRLSDVSSLTYGSRKEDERNRKEEERRLKREQKEQEKKSRELEKIRKRFNLTGNEVPVYMGVVKESIKGRRREDLVVKKGDRVSILRIGENPIGKWLAINDDGKVGYVDLTNIEVDADTVRYIMAQSKINVTCSGSADTSFETCDDEDSGEAIYEEFA